MCSASRPGRFTIWQRTPVTHWIWGWVDFKAGVDALHNRKSSRDHATVKRKALWVGPTCCEERLTFPGKAALAKDPPVEKDKHNASCLLSLTHIIIYLLLRLAILLHVRVKEQYT